MGGRGGSSGLSNSSSVSFNMKGEEKYKDSIKVLKVLFNEYETRLHEVTSGSQNSAGSVDISGYRMQLSSTDQATAIHEFAHTLANSAAEKYGLTKHADFWKEIKAIQRRYKKDVSNSPQRWISSYEHSHKGSDEFFAEAFAHAKMRELGIKAPPKYGSDYTYSQQVLKVVDKYFKRGKRR